MKHFFMVDLLVLNFFDHVAFDEAEGARASWRVVLFEVSSCLILPVLVLYFILGRFTITITV